MVYIFHKHQTYKLTWQRLHYAQIKQSTTVSTDNVTAFHSALISWRHHVWWDRVCKDELRMWKQWMGTVPTWYRVHSGSLLEHVTHYIISLWKVQTKSVETYWRTVARAKHWNKGRFKIERVACTAASFFGVDHLLRVLLVVHGI